jgi:translation elongation factor EF-Ts
VKTSSCAASSRRRDERRGRALHAQRRRAEPGKIGVLVALESEAGADVLEPLGKQIAMHIAAAFRWR